ncbi:MAG: hypothetical protein WBK77_01790 [Alphaproteobacteria bacterium]
MFQSVVGDLFDTKASKEAAKIPYGLLSTQFTLSSWNGILKIPGGGMDFGLDL